MANNYGDEGVSYFMGDTDQDENSSVRFADFAILANNYNPNYTSPNENACLYDNGGNLIVMISKDGPRRFYVYADGLFTKQELEDSGIVGAGDEIIEVTKGKFSSMYDYEANPVNSAETSPSGKNELVDPDRTAGKIGLTSQIASQFADGLIGELAENEDLPSLQ